MESKTPEKICALFNQIAPHYDQNNDIISFFTHRFIKQHVVNSIEELPPDARILDLCTGTGDIVKLLQKRFPNAHITGADFSTEMLKIARHKHRGTDFVLADCLQLPFENESFDLITMSFGLRNTTNYNRALSEIKRVLKPNGTFVHLDFGKDAKFVDDIFHKIVKFIAEIQEDDSYVYLLESKNNFPPAEQLIELFAAHGLETKLRKDYLQGIISAQHCVKN
ncbi:MAG: ubiquinone/menaquinone biosynthesis methyltransferase [Fusobacterium sp.]|nr:ubiquinone/menaquinone biosynthesis methyltransferase [Fusobacterium sp.]